MKTVLKFEAPWCGPCSQLSVLLSKIELTNILLTPVNVDTEQTLTKQYNLRAIPCLIMLDEDGTELRRLQGLPTVEKLKLFLGE
jgi:thioredoxin-like negative regulator of GroEL